MEHTYSDSLRNLLESVPFQAQSLGTPRDNFVSIDMEATTNEVKDIVKDACNKHISSIVISENDIPIGYSVIPRSDKNIKSYNPLRQYVKFKAKHYLKYNDTLEVIIKRFVDVHHSSDKTTSPPIFLIINKNDDKDNPIGLMTYWDLNRRSVYTFIYTIFVYFEQAMKIEVYESHKNGYENCIRDFIQKRDANKNKPRITYNRTDDLKYNISKLQFRELQTLLYDDHAFPNIQKKFPKDVICAIGEKRNRIAHPVNLVIDNGPNEISKNLRTLKTICICGKKHVIAYDDNPKNTVHHSRLNEIE